MCERCNDLCSTIDGCTGPTASECRSCRNETYTYEDTCVRDCSQLPTNDSIPFYNDDVTQSCELCDSSCSDRGCTGPGPSDCISPLVGDSDTDLFEAGTGTIAVVSVVCVVLLLLVILCIVIQLVHLKRSRSGKYKPYEPEVRSTEMTNRYATYKESQETEFNKTATAGKSATIASSSKLPAAEVPTADDMYTDMSGNEDTIKRPLTGPKPPAAVNTQVELYIDVLNPPEAGGETYTDMTMDVPGEEYVDVPSPTGNVVANPGYDESDGLYEDTDQAVEEAKAYIKFQKTAPPTATPTLPPSRSRPSIPTPANPLQDSMHRLVAAQQQQDSIYEEAPLEEQLYDAIGGGLPETTHPTSSKSKLPSSSNVLPLPPK